ncbi:MAG: hypothetical protein R2754_11170 [Microthrixaceae bacterium]
MGIAPAHHRVRRSRFVGACAVLAGALLAAACGSNDTGAAATERSTPAPVAGSELVGRWAHFDVVAYEDELMKTLIISFGFTDFAEQDGRLIESEEFCHADQASDQPIETSISDAATQAIKPPSTPVEVTGEPGKLRVRRPGTPTPIGIRLDDPANDPLPSDPDDPRIVDDDKDGKPGITVNVKVGDGFEGDLYLARREIFAYDMTQDGADSMVGTVTDSSEQLVIGTTNPVLASTSAQWTQYPDKSLSPIQLKRVGDDWDCDRLMEERDELFPPNPTADW